MAARNFAEAGPGTVTQPIGAKGGQLFDFGEIVMVDTGGFAVPGATAVSQLPGGVCAEKIDTTGAADGALTVKITYKGDYVEVDNSAGADAVLATDYNKPVYTLDRNAVSRLSAGKSKFGIFKGFSASGRVRVLVDPT